MDALDLDKNGTVEQAEFVDWIIRGVSRPLSVRIQWANKSPINRRLDHFLRAVTEVAIGEARSTEFRRLLRIVFAKFDKDKDGHINRNELTAMWTEITQTTGVGQENIDLAADDADTVVQSIDVDGNGLLEEDEVSPCPLPQNC